MAGAQGPGVQPRDPTRRTHQYLGGHVDADRDLLDHLGRRYRCKFWAPPTPSGDLGAVPALWALRGRGETLRSAD